MEVTPLPARARGLTLVELLVAVAVLMVLLAIGIPSWAHLSQSNAIIGARSEMRGLLGMARLAAVHHQRYATVCPSTDRVSCAADHTAWHQGALLFIDDNGNRKRERDERLLRVSNPFKSGIQIHTSRGRKALRFSGDGGAWGSNVTMRFCSPRQANRNKAIILYGSGRSRLSDKLPDGSRVTCP